jgi:hypothetical protein
MEPMDPDIMRGTSKGHAAVVVVVVVVVVVLLLLSDDDAVVANKSIREGRSEGSLIVVM